MFVGLDVHKKYAEVAIVDEDGAVEKRERIENKPEQIEEFSNRLCNATVVLESRLLGIGCMKSCPESTQVLILWSFGAELPAPSRRLPAMK